MKARLIGYVMAVLAAITLASVHAQENDTREGRRAVAGWLTLIDHGDFPASWQLAAPAFQQRIDQATWTKAVQSARGPLGALKERKLRAATATRTVPGAPDGEYVICVFDSTFENKAAAVETATAMRDADGTWKVVGYFVR